MPPSLDEITPSVVKLHEVAEKGLTLNGKVFGTVGLLLPDAGVGAVIPFGPGGKPPSDEFVVAKARERDAVGVVLTGQYWVNPAPLTRRQAAQDPRDLPLPSSLEPTERDEQILTTAVVRGQNDVLRILTPIVRGSFGTSLRERQLVREAAPMSTGEARHLLALIEKASTGK